MKKNKKKRKRKKKEKLQNTSRSMNEAVFGPPCPRKVMRDKNARHTTFNDASRTASKNES